ncbi:MFS transporter [Pararhodobacter sp.]|uniref:MFS transporter n=1 Tax=Pararhodobacter sp. TaxID=2127056 RepID=UPI002AFFE642|nr:MFS transporter [Pararhodobacter sp.]
MIRLAEFLRFNARWLGTGTLLVFLSSFGQTFFISIFAGAIREDFALSHGEWGGLYALATTASAAVMVFAGGLTDQLRVRVLGPLVILGLAVAALMMSQVTVVWALGVTVFLLRLFGQGLMSHTAMVAIARWFTATRGKAVGITGLGFALGEALLPITFVALLGVTAWRNLWIGAAVVLLILAPVVFVLMRQERTPQSFAASEGNTGMGGRNWTRANVLRSPVFWLMIPAVMGPAAWNTSFFFHQVHLAEVKGWSHAALVGMFPLFTVTGVVFLQIAGWMVDKFGSARLMPFYLLPSAAGFVVFALAATPLQGALGMLLMGASVGMNATMSSTLWAEAFGTRHIGSIRAMMAAVMVLGSAIGPGLTGALIDAGLDYAQQGWGVAAYFLGASVLAGVAARALTRE